MTPEEELQQLNCELINLNASLNSNHSETGDWKVVKSYEYFLAHQEIPYDFEELHAQREAIRVRIGEVNERIKELEQQIQPED